MLGVYLVNLVFQLSQRVLMKVLLLYPSTLSISFISGCGVFLIRGSNDAESCNGNQKT
jgi:hypothetical protein